VLLDLAVGQKHTPLQADAVADNDVGADGDVGTNLAVLANLGGGVDQDVAAVDVGFVCGSKELGFLLCQRGEVEACAADEILGLTDVHPEALEIERM